MRTTLLALAGLALLACRHAPQTSAPPLATSAPIASAPLPQRFAEGAIPPPSFADPDRAAKLAAAFPSIEKAFAKWAEMNHVPGAAMGVVIDGRLAYTKSIGVRDVDAKAPVDANTVFRIASMTKAFTATAVLALRDEGKLALDDPAATWIPTLSEAAYPTRDSRRMTVRDLLTHSAGFPEDNPWGDRQLALGVDALEKIAPSFSHTPGSEFEYSNLGWMWLGRIVARASGMTYESFVTDRVLKPLSMTATTFEMDKVPSAQRAVGYRRTEDRLEAEAPLASGAGAPMGGLWSNVDDLAKWAAFELSAWPARDDADGIPLRRSSVRESQTVQRSMGVNMTVRDTIRAQSMGYGFGWNVIDDCDVGRIVVHAGGLPGFGSVIGLLPDHGVAIVVLANLTYASAGAVLGPSLEALMATGALSRRAPKPAPALIAMQREVDKLLDAWDDAQLGRIAAENVALDTPTARRKSELDALRKAHGQCHDDGAIEVENALRGTWRRACDRGWVDVTISLTPEGTPRLQTLDVRDGFPADERLARVVNQVVAHVGSEGDAEYAPVAAFPRGAATCAVDRWLEGDGKSRATVRIRCGARTAAIVVAVDPTSGKLARVSPPRGNLCVDVHR